MSNIEFFDRVRQLRTHKVSVTNKNGRFREQERSNLSPTHADNDNARHGAGHPNVLRYESSDQIEYLTRKYCRCGHYLRGQLEDGYLAWEEYLRASNEELSAEVGRKQKPVHFAVLLTMLFFVVPMLYIGLWQEGFALSTYVWTLLGFAVLGVMALIDKYLMRPIDHSTWVIDNISFKTFFE